MGAYQENLFRSRSKYTSDCFICRIIFEKYSIKAIEDFFLVWVAPSKHEGSWEGSRYLCKPETQSLKLIELACKLVNQSVIT